MEITTPYIINRTMMFFNAISFLLLNVACSYASLMEQEISNEGFSAHHRRSQQMIEELESLVVQTFYIPFPEDIMFHNFFAPICSKTSGQIQSIIAVAISTDNTVIWYDHWEDGYDVDASKKTSVNVTTQVWGDGNAANGCQPAQVSCTDLNDLLMAGTSFVITNWVDPIRNRMVYSYDGGDKVATNFPIAITRGGYPTNPGSLLAGAMEVLDTSYWGKDYISPVGNVSMPGVNPVRKESFEFTSFLVMAKEANTTVQLRHEKTGVTTATFILNEGESRLILTKISQPLVANKAVQVDIITGNINSAYESRWYSLLDLSQWSKEYVSPTGETFGKTKLVLYNPNNIPITVTMETWNKTTNAKVFQTVNVLAKDYSLSPYVLDGTGAQVTSTEKFMALSITDSERFTSTGNRTDGCFFDWGFSLQPRADLTSQVLIAWGYGCTNNLCGANGTESPRSVVWVTATEDADLYIDFKNSGNATIMPVKRLQSVKITDPIDKDMSGAMIFATIPNGTPDSRPVSIAASWGQDPSVSQPIQSLSLDLGTTVLPFFNILVNKVVDKETVSPGEYLIYTIRMYNLGQSRIKAKKIRLKDALDPWVDYVPGTTTVAIVNSTLIQGIPDDTTGTGTAFPLDALGALIPYRLKARGGMIDVTFEVKLKPASEMKMSAEIIVNNGIMQGDTLPTLPFEATSKVVYTPNVTLTNTVYLGSDSAGGSCQSAVEYVEGFKSTDVVYCFNITNNGHTFLNNVTLQDGELVYKSSIKNLAPGESITVPFVSKINSNLTNVATVIGNPIFANGTDIPGLTDVNATDPSAVGVLPCIANATLTNTVCLTDVNATDPSAVGLLPCIANVTLTNAVCLTDVNATDPSAVGVLSYVANVTLSNTVYLGSDSAGENRFFGRFSSRPHWTRFFHLFWGYHICFSFVAFTL